MNHPFSVFLSFVLLLWVGCATSASPSLPPTENYHELVNQLTHISPSLRKAYWEKAKPLLSNKTLPETRDDSALFLAEVPGVKRMTLYGEPSRWNSPGIEMKKFEGTDLFYLDKAFEAEARLKYRFLPEGRETLGIPDAGNPLFEMSGLRKDSVLVMPGYSHPETEVQDGALKGHLEIFQGDLSFPGMTAGKRERSLMLYIPPPSPVPAGGFPLVIFGDGAATVKESRLPTVLDHLIATGELAPVYALFVEPLDRDGEYLGNQRETYLQLLTRSLIPLLESRFPLSQDREKRVLVGASNGGEFVTWAGIRAPEVFGRIFNQSGVPSGQSIQAWRGTKFPAKVYTAVGLYERDFNISGAKSFHETLGKNPLILEKLVFLPQGHSWRMWGDCFKEGLLWLLSASVLPLVPDGADDVVDLEEDINELGVEVFALL